MLIENEDLLKTKYSKMWDSLQTFQPYFQLGQAVVETAKNGQPTIKMEIDSKQFYVHSKYNPSAEAENFLSKYEDIDTYRHIFFYGLGMGHHIEALMKVHPNKVFTVYEPTPEILYRFLETRPLSDLPLHLLQHFYIEWNPEVISHCLSHFLENVNEKTLLVIHPSYERIDQEKTKDFIERFKKALSGQLSSIGVNARFERLWTLNSLLNFPYVLNTPNIIREKKQLLESKPALLVAAGPSLEDELDHIKYIKDNGLAYIFSVGSSIKALLGHGIQPDAVCAYDPETGLEGLDTYQEIIEQNIDTIPLIYGSSLGFNTVRRFPGPMMHAFTTQDTVSPFYLGEDQVRQDNGIVSDAPSIALVTLEILAKVGCSPVILVGQNFAYRNNQYYASGIQYATRPNELSEEEKKSLLTVEGVEGEQVVTSRSHNDSRHAMEHYISVMNHIKVYNATRGGARIEGAEYRPLINLLEEELREKVVRDNWYQSDKTNYDLGSINEKVRIMQREYKKAIKVLDEMVEQFRVMKKLIDSKSKGKLEKQFPVFDKLFIKLQNNSFYSVFMQPMLRLQQQVLHRFVPEIRNSNDTFEKAQKIMDNFGKYLLDCQREVRFLTIEFNKLQARLGEMADQLSIEENNIDQETITN